MKQRGKNLTNTKQPVEFGCQTGFLLRERSKAYSNTVREHHGEKSRLAPKSQVEEGEEMRRKRQQREEVRKILAAVRRELTEQRQHMNDPHTIRPVLHVDELFARARDSIGE